MHKLAVATVAILCLGPVVPVAHAQMCGSSAGAMCGMGQPVQAQGGQSAMPAMPGMMPDRGQQGQQGQPAQQGQGMMGGMMMQGCPMMKQMASLQERVRHMEEMMGMTPQQGPAAPPAQQ